MRRLLPLALCVACADTPESVAPPEPAPAITPAASSLHRLTQAQYKSALRDIFGEDIVLPTALEPDDGGAGLLAIGATRTTISSYGVEQYESASYLVAEQAMATPERRARFVPCPPASTRDDTCAAQALDGLGLRVWRRPLVVEERDALVAVAGRASASLGDFFDGFEFAIAALLQSPNFLFRAELGAPDGRYDAWELASRLSFFLWNTTPDAGLLAAAADGTLLEDARLAAEVDRLLASPRAREGVKNLFSELYELYELDHLVKDPKIFVHYTAELGAEAREETLRLIEHFVFEELDYRDLFTTRTTFINRRLAAIYDVRAPAREGFARTELPESSGRRGLLGHASLLGLYAHSVASSATLRGQFVRRAILCGEIPPPPVNVNTALPEPTGNRLTLRDRVDEHLSNPACAGCHSLMDPIGLGLERFDGIGRARTKDNGATIDASGVLDGVAFGDAWALAQVVRDHPSLGPCLARSVYRYATGNLETEGEKPLVAWLGRELERSGFKVKALLRAVALSDGFRKAREAAK